MRIGVDISQTAYLNIGVSNYLIKTLESLFEIDRKNSYTLFFSSLRGKVPLKIHNLVKKYNNVTIKQFPFPPTLLDILWNKLHILPIEKLIGTVDVFLSSDWTQPPTRNAKSVTILYDLIVYTYPNETDKKIVNAQKRRLEWVKKECEKIICISEATKKDAIEILGIEEKTLTVVYPGI